MPIYRNGCICLSVDEAKELCRKIAEPDEECTKLRDDFLAHIDKTLGITPTEDGVLLGSK